MNEDHPFFRRLVEPAVTGSSHHELTSKRGPVQTNLLSKLAGITCPFDNIEWKEGNVTHTVHTHSVTWGREDVACVPTKPICSATVPFPSPHPPEVFRFRRVQQQRSHLPALVLGFAPPQISPDLVDAPPSTLVGLEMISLTPLSLVDFGLAGPPRGDTARSGDADLPPPPVPETTLETSAHGHLPEPTALLLSNNNTPPPWTPPPSCSSWFFP